MTNVGTVITFEQLVQDFDSLFKHRVFRLETLDWYDAPNEREPYARFLAGDPADWAWREPWQRLVRGHLAAGRIMQRVHVVTEPVSDYVRFEMLHVYPANVAAGEDVRIIGRREAIGQLTTARDYWLFDHDRMAVLNYSDSGGVESVDMITGATSAERFMLLAIRQERDRALWLSVPLAQYVAEHNLTEKEHAA